MRVIAILILVGLAFWALKAGWGILSVLFVAAIGYLIATDKQGRSIDSFYALGFAVIILGGVAGLIRYLIQS